MSVIRCPCREKNYCNFCCFPGPPAFLQFDKIYIVRPTSFRPPLRRLLSDRAGKLLLYRVPHKKTSELIPRHPISSSATICHFIVQHTSPCLAACDGALLAVNRQTIDWLEWNDDDRPVWGWCPAPFLTTHKQVAVYWRRTRRVLEIYNGSVTFCKSTCHHCTVHYVQPCK